MLTVPSVGRNPEYLELPSSAVRQEDTHTSLSKAGLEFLIKLSIPVSHGPKQKHRHLDRSVQGNFIRNYQNLETSLGQQINS